MLCMFIGGYGYIYGYLSCLCAHVEARGQVAGVCSLYHVNPGYPTQVVELGDKWVPLPVELSHWLLSPILGSALGFPFPFYASLYFSFHDVSSLQPFLDSGK